MRGKNLLAAALIVTAMLVAGCAAEEGVGVPVSPVGEASGGVGVPTERDPDVLGILDPCPESGESLGRGDGLPDVELPCLGPGDPVRMSGLLGRPRLINVWASWCPPCRDELPWLQRAADTGEVAVLGVDAEDRTDAAADLLAALEVSFPSVFDPANEFARSLGVPTKPTTVFVTAEGEIAYVKAGSFTSFDDLAEQVDTYLGVKLR